MNNRSGVRLAATGGDPALPPVAAKRIPPVAAKRIAAGRAKKLLVLTALAAWLLLPSLARAHRLEGQAVVRPFGQIQVEGWFETGESAVGARVQVFADDGRLVTQGKLNDKGIFIFPYSATEPLRLVINAGGGHRTEVRLAVETVMRHLACTAAACLAPNAPLLPAALLPSAPTHRPVTSEPLVERRSGAQLWNLLIGVVILVTVAVGARQWRRLRPSSRRALPPAADGTRLEP